MGIERLMSLEEAQRRVLAIIRPGPVERTRLAEAEGRVLGAPITCDMDYPPFDKAMMDGYAVRRVDVSLPEAECRVVGKIAAGGFAGVEIGRGEAVQINTGAPVPRGADTVVRVEETEISADGSRVRVKVGVRAGTNIEKRGRYVTEGTVVLEAGTVLGPAAMGVAAAAGAAEVTVYRRPRVGVLVTGEELVEVGIKPTGGQIRDSNRYVLAALARRSGAEAVVLGAAGDDRGELKEKVEEGLACDFLCISGGISMGEFDFVPDVLAACGVEFLVRKIAIRPGKPTIVGMSRRGGYVFALPGNPISSFIGYLVLLGPALEAWQGRGMRLPVGMRARLAGELPASGERLSYWPVRVVVDVDGQLQAEGVSWRGSGDLFGFCRANGVAVRAAGAAAARSGEFVTVYMLECVGWDEAALDAQAR